MSDDLIIKISADSADAVKKITELGDAGDGLESKLANVAKISAVAFAALTAQVGFSLKAFEEADAASRSLSTALQNQGIFTTQLKDAYKDYAEQVQKTTGFEAEQITKAQAVAQAYLGQVPITQQLTAAIADLAQAQGISLTQAAEELGKAIGNGTGALLREGLQISATSTEAQRYATVLDFVTTRYGGQAAAANQGLGAIRGLSAAFNDAQQELGARFAPAVGAVIEALTNLITPSKENNSLFVDMKASAIAVGLALTGAVTAVYAIGTAVTAFKAAVLALNLELTATRVLLAGLGIGLVTIAITELALHWKQAMAVVTSVTRDMVEFVSKAFGGLKEVLDGALHLSTDKIKAGLKEIADAFTHIKDNAVDAYKSAADAGTKSAETQIASKKALADKLGALKAEQEATRQQLAQAEKEAIILELNDEAEAEIALKKQEIALLKQLETEKNADMRALLHKQIAEVRQDEDITRQEDLKREEEFNEEQMAALQKHGNDKVVIETQTEKKEIANIQKTERTQRQAQQKVYQDDLKDRVQRHNTFLDEQIKYGTAYATINQAINSSEVQGVKQATSDLVQLTQSKNATLKEIGKIATVANIVIKTAESAMNIYAGFSTIPIVGPALGIAGAAAAIAFGAEQIRNVTAAQTGAVVGGTGFGDSQPYLLEPKEIVAPRQSFDEVINGVIQQRGYQTEDSSGGSQQVSVVIGFSGPEASRVLTARQIEDKSLGVYRGA